MALGIEELTADPAVVLKLKRKHGVAPEEAEQVVFSRTAHIRRGSAGLYLIYRRTLAGRYLFVVIGLRGRLARLVTAREMTWSERRFYGRQTRS